MLRHLIYPLLPYRSILAPFLLVCAVAVPCWLIVRLVRLRRRALPVSFARELLLLVLVVYLSGLAAATLTPNRSSRMLAEGRGGIALRPDLTSLTCSTAKLRRGSTAHSFCVRNARGNVVLFIPLGILLPLVWRRLRHRHVVLIALMVSGGIELVQYFSSAWGSYRAADVNDVILNLFGACLGLSVIALLRLWRRDRPTVAIA
jgi:glycopeptide antibiotics resistance protein